ncbi:MAG: OmpA family protein [Chitinophagales bacterium]|nr:OmpA family protein [Chitinophagales bacterium]
MRKLSCLFVLFLCCSFPSFTQITETDGNWTKQFLVLKNTPEADAMIRVGDIDNLGHGWAEGFNPFSGRNTDPHGYPWELNKNDAPGTDRIMIPAGYRYGSDAPHDGYTGSTERPANNPVPLIIPLNDIKDITVTSAALQLFIDDFQSPEYQKKFQFRMNGQRFVEAEKVINGVNQAGPVGKLISFKFTDEQLSMLQGDSLVIFIDDPVTATGDGFAIDFVKLLINPKGVLYKGSIKGTIIDEETKMPIANATAEIKDYGIVQTDAEGNFLLQAVPAGLNMVAGSADGYSSAQKQVDVIEGETTEDVVLELKRSGKVKFNDKTLQEGDHIVMKNIQFQVNSAVLLAAGKQELDKLAAFMNQNPSMEILLSGHTSSEGSASLNRELSLKRVRSCKDYLISKGIDEGLITIKGLGQDQPIAPNDTEANRAKNRRVELKITKL